LLGVLTKTLIPIFSLIFSQNFWKGCSPAVVMNELPLYEIQSLLRSWRYLSW